MDDNNLKVINELGKLYDSFQDKKLLCDFFLENSMTFAGAKRGYFFLSGKDDKIWLESISGIEETASAPAKKEAQKRFNKGQPAHEAHQLWIPLIVQNQEIGIVGYEKDESDEAFSDQDMLMASNLVSQVAGALKTIVLFEDNIRMERLAAIGQTVGVVMHEVKNIIQLAKFSEEFLRRGLESMDEKKLKRGHDGIRKALSEMDGFIYEMLSLTKDYEIKPEKVNPKSLFEELYNDFKDRGRHMKVEIKFACDESLQTIECEPRSIYRVLVNMIKNAMEAANYDRDDSYIKVSAVDAGPEIYHLVIEDNGMGMSDETKAKLFQAFFSTKGERGTGLGLMIIDRTIKAHHGEVALASELGKGTTFTIKLPKKIAG